MIGQLSAQTRAQDLAALLDDEQLVDLLVVGGGITGAGVALDAASRGLSVALVERRDLAWGTSRFSSKLVHGGLRYLAVGEVGLAYESARERHVLMTTTAPHLVRALPFMLPLNGDVSRRSAAVAQVGLNLAETLRIAARTPSRLLPRARRINAEAARGLVPALAPVRGGLVHWDGQLVDDARLVIAVARTAKAHGARIVTRCAVESVDGDGAHIRDELSGQTGRIRARCVVVATGVWANELVGAVRLQPSRGTHLVVRGDAFGGATGAMTVIVPGTHNRWVLAVPQPDPGITGAGTVLVGLTDDPVDGAVPDVAAPGPDDERFLLDVVSRALQRDITPADVLSRFAGLRPLVAGAASAATADLSRRHVLVSDPATGVLALVGGKLTTYRSMAEAAVDAVVAKLGRGGPCRTRTLPLVGAGAPATLSSVRAPSRLVRRYGTEAPAVLALADSRPDLLEPVAEGVDVLGVEFAFGARYEGALEVDDLLARRTRLSLAPAAAEAAAAAAEWAIGGEVLPSVT